MNRTGKTVWIKKLVMEDIRTLRPGDAIPSRTRYMARAAAARATVDRAVAELIRDGVLCSRQGAGTFVAEGGTPGAVAQVCMVGAYPPGEDRFFPEDSLEESVRRVLPCRIVPFRKLPLLLNEMCRPGSAVVWKYPGYEHWMSMEFLAAFRVPQLLYNRDFGSFACITLDVGRSIESGLEWLLAGSAGPMGFVSSRSDPHFPYIADRKLAFFELALRRGIAVPDRWMFCDFPRSGDGMRFMRRAAEGLFRGAAPCRAVYLDFANWYGAFTQAAAEFGKMPGRDYRILIFDRPKNWSPAPGEAAMRQSGGGAAQLLLDWLKAPEARLRAVFRTELVTAEKCLETSVKSYPQTRS